MSERKIIGVWLPWPVEASFTVEGMTRLLGFMIEGVARNAACSFHVVVTPSVAAPARAFLRGLQAQEGRDWVLHVLPPPRVLIRPRLMALLLVAGFVLAAPLYLARRLLRPLRPRLAMVRARWRDPSAGADRTASYLRRIPALGPGLARRFEDWALKLRASTPPPGAAPHAAAAAAVAQATLFSQGEAQSVAWAAAHVRTDGWLIMFPFPAAAAALPLPRAVLFPDAIPLAFPGGWPDEAWQPGGEWFVWSARTRHLLAAGGRVITFSGHVARDHVRGYFGVAAERLRVIPHAAPDLAHHLPFLAGDRRRTPASRAAAAELLRAHAAERGWTYLRDFPFEETLFIAVSTQDRPNKNIRLVAEAVRLLVRERLVDIKLFFTAKLAANAPLTTYLEEHAFHFDAVSVPHLPDAVHAALFHAAALTVHPSVFEGGHAPFPFNEAVSVGTPCLVADGPHVREWAAAHPDAPIAEWTVDPYDAEALADRIEAAIAGRAALLDRQMPVHAAMRQRGWGDVAAAYAAAVLDPPATAPAAGANLAP